MTSRIDTDLRCFSTAVGILVRDGVPLADAEDIAGDALVTILNKRVTGVERRRLYFTVVRRRKIDWWRRDSYSRRLRVTLTDGLPDPASELPLPRVDRAALDAAMRSLVPKVRCAVIAHFLRGRSIREIAAEERVSRETIRLRVRAGITTLRRRLAG